MPKSANVYVWGQTSSYIKSPISIRTDKHIRICPSILNVPSAPDSALSLLFSCKI